MKIVRKVYPTSYFRTGWLLACVLASAAQADMGPAIVGHHRAGQRCVYRVLEPCGHYPD